MPKRTRSYRSWQMAKLANPDRAANYLNAAFQDSSEAFLIALSKVAQARQMTKVAKEAGVQRETLYRSFSKQGNPTLETLSSVLNAVGLRLLVGVEEAEDRSPFLKSVHARGETPGERLAQEKVPQADFWGTDLNIQDGGYAALGSIPVPFIPGNNISPEGALHASSGNY